MALAVLGTRGVDAGAVEETAEVGTGVEEELFKGGAVSKQSSNHQ